MMKRVKNIAEIQHVDLKNVRHSDLGDTIELLEQELPLLETLYKQLLLDNDEKSAFIIRQVLNATDFLLYEYDNVR